MQLETTKFSTADKLIVRECALWVPHFIVVATLSILKFSTILFSRNYFSTIDPIRSDPLVICIRHAAHMLYIYNWFTSYHTVMWMCISSSLWMCDQSEMCARALCSLCWSKLMYYMHHTIYYIIEYISMAAGRVFAAAIQTANTVLIRWFRLRIDKSMVTMVYSTNIRSSSSGGSSWLLTNDSLILKLDR